MISRHSSRRNSLVDSFLNKRLQGAQSYDRIAGYFCSSLLSIAGEALDSVQGTIRVLCNAHLSSRDALVLTDAYEQLRREWCAWSPEQYAEKWRGRYALLHGLLVSKRMVIRIVPDELFGMLHGKAGVIITEDGTPTSFLGSANDSDVAWRDHYELIWEDHGAEAVAWVQEEFDVLWNAAEAVPLPDFIIRDLERLSRRRLFTTLAEWRQEPLPQPSAAIIESPLFRKELGLWDHQKFFVELAFKAHRTPWGARLILADQVGLGKTLQLACAALLMALWGDKPILIMVPKPIIGQWQRELKALLQIESAAWNGRFWCNEEGVEFADAGSNNIRRCPRRFGIISTGLVTRKSAAADALKELSYECVILDEAHRARCERQFPNLKKKKENNLYIFVKELSKKTHSLLLATATPVQMHPIEALDLLKLLHEGSGNSVLGNSGSLWHHYEGGLQVVMGEGEIPSSRRERWRYLSNPLPLAEEKVLFDELRQELCLASEVVYAHADDWEKLRFSLQNEIERDYQHLIDQYNPFIRRIILRTRRYLEEKINPLSGRPYLPKISVVLHGEGEEGALQLPRHLQDAYSEAEQFCKEIAQNTGLLKTLVLRRLGSTLHAGQLTVRNLYNKFVLNGVVASSLDDDEDEEDEGDGAFVLHEKAKKLLTGLHSRLKDLRSEDPKYHKVVALLAEEQWLEKGCIIFSQYYDSVSWLAEKLSSHFPDEPIGLYAGSNRSSLWRNGIRSSMSREKLKEMVAGGALRLLLGTDAASEGLNLQKLSSLINLDLPWNPSRLEQRKGRIQRIGQERPSVDLFNMRYADTVEDRVHRKLSTRLEKINQLFGQVPDTLEDIWIDMALDRQEDAFRKLERYSQQHPFGTKYEREVYPLDWESCAQVLECGAIQAQLGRGW